MGDSDGISEDFEGRPLSDISESLYQSPPIIEKGIFYKIKRGIIGIGQKFRYW